MSFNLAFANNAILSYLFFFFLIIDLYFLIFEIIAQNFNPTAERVTLTKEAKAEMEI